MIRYGFSLLLGTFLLLHPAQAQSATAKAQSATDKAQSATDKAQSATDKADDGDEELNMVINNYVAAYSTGDIDQVMGFWAENADFVDIRGRFHEGRDLISALFRRGFAENPGRTLQLNSASRKLLSPNVAMDDGILVLSSPDGESVRGRYTVVWSKVDGDWRIRSARDIPIDVELPPDEAQGPPLEELAWLVGKWEANTDKYKIKLDCDWTLDKNFLAQTFHVNSSDEDFQVVTYIAFDPAEGRYRSWFFDSRGGFGSGSWSVSDKVYRVNIVMVVPDGRIGSSVMSWEPVDADTVKWRATEREIGGEILPDTEQSYMRAK
jgi:uncharacterized protein (TIGR02246 family)